MGTGYRTHELVRWWLQEVEQVRDYILRLLLRLPRSHALWRVSWQDTHPSFDLPRLEVDGLFDVWISAYDSAMVITEIQNSRDPQKAVTWMAYLSATQLRFRKSTMLGILTFTDTMAHWCRQQVVRPAKQQLAVQVRVLGPQTWRHQPSHMPPGPDALCRHVMCWLSGQRIAEFERTLTQLINFALGLDSPTWRWYIATLCRIAELHAPHLKEHIMNQVQRKHPFMPIFDHEWEAVERGRVEGRVEGRDEGRDEGRVEGRVEALQRVLQALIGAQEVARVLATTPSTDHERVLYDAIQARMSRAQ
jgi:hypothetical protein